MAKLRGNGQTGRFAYHTLSLQDSLSMECESFIPNDGPKDRLHALEDAKQCWRENRHLYLQPRGNTLADCMGFSPGKRPWGFWLLDRNYSEVPGDQISELNRLRLLSTREKSELVELFNLYPRCYSDQQISLIKSWGPAPEGAEIRTFPASEEEAGDSDDL